MNESCRSSSTAGCEWRGVAGPRYHLGSPRHHIPSHRPPMLAMVLRAHCLRPCHACRVVVALAVVAVRGVVHQRFSSQQVS